MAKSISELEQFKVRNEENANQADLRKKDLRLDINQQLENCSFSYKKEYLPHYDKLFFSLLGRDKIEENDMKSLLSHKSQRKIEQLKNDPRLLHSVLVWHRYQLKFSNLLFTLIKSVLKYHKLKSESQKNKYTFNELIDLIIKNTILNENISNELFVLSLYLKENDGLFKLQDITWFHQLYLFGPEDVKYVAKEFYDFGSLKFADNEIARSSDDLYKMVDDLDYLFEYDPTQKDLLHSFCPILNINLCYAIFLKDHEQPINMTEKSIKTLKQVLRVATRCFDSTKTYAIFYDVFKSNLKRKMVEFCKEFPTKPLTPEDFAKQEKELNKEIQSTKTKKKQRLKQKKIEHIKPVRIDSSDKSGKIELNSNTEKEIKEEEKLDIRDLSTYQESVPVPAVKMPSPVIINAPINITLHPRVRRWLKLNPNKPIPFAGYENNNEPHEILWHALPRELDAFLSRKDYCWEKDFHVKDEVRKNYHMIAQFDYKDKTSDRGVITYSIVDGVCIHRYFKKFSTAYIIQTAYGTIFDSIKIDDEKNLLSKNDEDDFQYVGKIKCSENASFVEFEDTESKVKLKLYKKRS